jgi:hypothetical protein
VDEQHIFRALQLGDVFIGRRQQAEEGRCDAIGVAVWRLGEPVDSGMEEHPKAPLWLVTSRALKPLLTSGENHQVNIEPVCGFGSKVMGEEQSGQQASNKRASSHARSGSPSPNEAKPQQNARGRPSQDSQRNQG